MRQKLEQMLGGMKTHRFVLFRETVGDRMLHPIYM